MTNAAKTALLWTAAGLGALAAGRALLRYQRRYTLRGKTALVTGGSRGLGLVLARELASEGMRVAICARDAEELDRARLDLEGRGARVLAIPCDLSDRGQIERLIGQVVARFGTIHVLINNAGVIQVGPMEEMTPADYEEAMKVHYWGPLWATLAVLPHLRRQGHGRIVNITSIGGKVAVPHLLPYDASKFALVGLSEGLRAELLKDNIYVTTVCPGLMRTGSPPNALFKGQHRKEYAWFALGDSIPGLSTSAGHAARRILNACRHGDAEVVLTLPAQVAVAFHGFFPGLTSDILGLVNRMLPGPGGIGQRKLPGRESESAIAPSALTTLTERAADRNNERAAARSTDERGM